MAQSIDDIYNSMLAEKANHGELDALNSSSQVAMWKLYFFVVAVCQWAQQKKWDAFRVETDNKIATQKDGKSEFYRQLAFNFQYGYNLTSAGVYDNSNLTTQQIDDSKIIKYCSVTEVDGKLRMKVALRVNNQPSPLSTDQLAAFAAYIEKLKFDGVKINKESLPPDNLKLQLDIWFNPLVLRADGSMIDGSSATPVKDAILAYLNQLPFNGEYANTRLVDFLQSVNGIQFPVIKLAQAKYGLYPFINIDEKYIPDAGYLNIADADLIINYRQYV